MAEPVKLKDVAQLAAAVWDTGRRLKRMERRCRLDSKELAQQFAYLQLMLASFGIEVPGTDERGGHSHGEEEDEKGTTPES